MHKLFGHPLYPGRIGVLYQRPWGDRSSADVLWLWAPPNNGKVEPLPQMPVRYPEKDLVPWSIQIEDCNSFALRVGDRLDLSALPEHTVYCGRQNSKYFFSRSRSPLANPWSVREVQKEIADKPMATAEVCRRFNLLLKQAIRHPTEMADLYGKTVSLAPIWNALSHLLALHQQAHPIRLLCWCEGQCHTWEIVKALAALAHKQQEKEHVSN